MFQFPACPLRLRSDRSLHLPGCPIRKSVDHCALAAPYRVSPLGTSFIGTLPLGIPQKPCLTLNTLHSTSTPSYLHDDRGDRCSGIQVFGFQDQGVWLSPEHLQYPKTSTPMRVEDETPFHAAHAELIQLAKNHMSEDAYPQCKQLKRPSQAIAIQAFGVRHLAFGFHQCLLPNAQCRAATARCLHNSLYSVVKEQGSRWEQCPYR